MFFIVLMPILVMFRNKEVIEFDYYIIYFFLGLPTLYLAYESYKNL